MAILPGQPHTELMKLFIDSADPKEIAKLAETGLVDGVTTNPSLAAKTGLLDTHPSTADRVQRARQLGENGGALSEAPARELFEGFETVSRLVTLAHYQDDLNVPITPDFLIPLEQLILAKSAPAPAPAAAPAMPLMRYDPTAFRACE